MGCLCSAAWCGARLASFPRSGLTPHPACTARLRDTQPTCWHASPSSPPRQTVTAPQEPSAWRLLYHKSPTPSYTAEQAGSGALTDQLPVCSMEGKRSTSC